MTYHDGDGILVYLENQSGVLKDISAEMIGEAVRLREKKNQPIYAVGITSEVELLKRELEGYPLDKVYLYQCREEFQAFPYAVPMEECIQEVKPGIVLIGGTTAGRALAPRIAVAFKTGLTADCTELDLDETGNLIQTRPAFGGNIMASILTESIRPQIATVRAGIMQPIEKSEDSPIDIELRELDSTGFAQTLEIIEKNRTAGIEQQELIVAAGRGVAKKEDLEMLRRLAQLLHGTLASSRALVEKGWMKPEEQIGLSGTTVRPKCIITFGISGSVQFQAGMKHTPNIIAVNTDPHAKILEIAHYPICADLYDIVPKWIEQLEKQ